MDDPSLATDERPPADVFGALADPVRIAILEALWEADGHEATFSELQSAVGVEDSGHFNYHAAKLRGTFVTADEGVYRLRLAGRRVVGALLSGVYTQTGAADVVVSTHDCPLCSTGALRFRYETELLRIDCVDCETELITFPVPPGALAVSDPEQLPVAAERYGRSFLAQNRAGFCTNCEGPVTATVDRAGSLFPDDPLPADVPIVVYDCPRCGEQSTVDLRTAVAAEPTVVAFHHDQRVDLDERPLWELFVVDERSRVLEHESGHAAVSFEEGGERLTVTVDETATVIDTDRT